MILPLAQPLARPLARPLASFLSGGLDPDAAAYIDAVVATGVTFTGGQRSAINEFIKSEKAAARYTLLKRLYLPIWGQNEANAICLKSLTSGTFVGNVTPGAGFVQSDGTTGYFDQGSSFGGAGLTKSSMSVGGLVLDVPSTSRPIFGAGTGSTYTAIRTGNSANTTQMFFTGAGQTAVDTPCIGLVSLASDGTDLRMYKRVAASRTLLQTVSVPSGSLAASNVFWMARNNTDTAGATSLNNPGTYRFALGWMANFMTDAQDQAFTASLQTLWQNLTGLTIPS